MGRRPQRGYLGVVQQAAAALTRCLALALGSYFSFSLSLQEGGRGNYARYGHRYACKARRYVGYAVTRWSLTRESEPSPQQTSALRARTPEAQPP
jgi:hypothetical protein